jgi:hypothetical protein
MRKLLAFHKIGRSSSCLQKPQSFPFPNSCPPLQFLRDYFLINLQPTLRFSKQPISLGFQHPITMYSFYVSPMCAIHLTPRVPYTSPNMCHTPHPICGIHLTQYVPYTSPYVCHTPHTMCAIHFALCVPFTSTYVCHTHYSMCAIHFNLCVPYTKTITSLFFLLTTLISGKEFKSYIFSLCNFFSIVLVHKFICMFYSNCKFLLH